MWAVSLTWMNHTRVQLFTGSVTLVSCRYTQVVLHDILHGRGNTYRASGVPSLGSGFLATISVFVHLPSVLLVVCHALMA